jgi:hypothetical protein
MRCFALAVALALVPRAAAAQDLPLLSAADVGAACDAARAGEHDRLLSIVVDPGWRFRSLETEFAEDGTVAASALPVDTRRNLRALRGRVEVMPAGLETIGFVASESRAVELEAARVGGARLRIGFFLGFDDPGRSACLVRGSRAISLVRMDVAFLELLDVEGRVLARQDTDRFTSWSDDRGRDVLPGSGPRAVVGEATISTGRLPANWQGTLSGPELGAALGRCHEAGVGRGADGDASVRVRLTVERAGRVVASTVELANVGDEEELRCIEGAVGALSLPGGPAELPARVDVLVPIRLAD